MKFLPHRDKAGHDGDADLAAEDADKVHKSGDGSSVCGSLQGSSFKRLDDDAAHQAYVGARQADRQQQFHTLEGISCPRRIRVRPQPTADGAHREPHGQNQPRIGVDHDHGNQPDHGEHGHGNPGESVPGFERTVLLNIRQKPWYEHNRGQMHEFEDKNRQGDNVDVSGVQERKIENRVGLRDPPRERRTQKKDPGNGHSNDRAGVKPIQPLPLVEGAIEESEAQAEIDKSMPTRPRVDGELAGNSEIDAKHHHRSEERGRPKDPVPGEVLNVPSLEQRGDVADEDDVRRIGCNPEDDQPLGKSGQHKGHGERIKST